MQKTEEAAALYPSATRVQPEAKANPKIVKQLQEMQELFEKQENDKVIAKAEAIAAMPSAGAYEKSFAYSLAGNAAADKDDQSAAANYFAKSVEANGLDNNSHFSTMYNLAVIQCGNEKYAEALATMDRFLAETKSSKPEHAAFRAGILANMGRHDEDAVAYKKLVADNPGDKRLLMNAVAALQNADKFAEGNVLLEDAYKRGMLTEPRELRALYVGYMNASRWDDAQKVMDDGTAKGILQAGPELAKDYMVLAQNAYVDDKIPQAIALRRWTQDKTGVTLGLGLGAADPDHGLRIAHMGHANAHQLLGTLAVIEAGMQALGIPHGPGGIAAAAGVIARSA